MYNFQYIKNVKILCNYISIFFVKYYQKLSKITKILQKTTFFLEFETNFQII